MNDRLMTQVAAMIAPALRSVEIERAQRKPTASLTAFDLYLQALPRFGQSLADNRRPCGCWTGPLHSIPPTPPPYGLAARCYQFQKLMGWVPPNDPGLDEGVRLAHRRGGVGQERFRGLVDGRACAGSARRRDRSWPGPDRQVAVTQSQLRQRVDVELPGAHLSRRLRARRSIIFTVATPQSARSVAPSPLEHRRHGLLRRRPLRGRRCRRRQDAARRGRRIRRASD